jgi:hypothetical protein
METISEENTSPVVRATMRPSQAVELPAPAIDTGGGTAHAMTSFGSTGFSSILAEDLLPEGILRCDTDFIEYFRGAAKNERVE